MTISAQNLTYFGQAPVAGGSTILAAAGSSMLEQAYIGTVTITGDGANTSQVINYLDGTNALAWTPTAVTFIRTGGNAANSIVCYATATNNVVATVTMSAAPGNNASITGMVQIYK